MDEDEGVLDCYDSWQAPDRDVPFQPSAGFCWFAIFVKDLPDESTASLPAGAFGPGQHCLALCVDRN